MIVNAIIVAVLLAGAAYVAYRMYAYYDSTQGTIKDRLLATARQSLTIFIQYLVIIGSAAYASIGYIGEVLGHPEVQEWFKANVPPQYTGGVVAAIAVITILARLRTIED